MDSWTVSASPGAKPLEGMPDSFLVEDITGLSQPPALWRDPPAFMDSLEPPAGLGDVDNNFCWSNNLDHCISYLNKELGALGLPALYHDDVSGADRKHGFSLLALVNGTCGLLNLYQGFSAKLVGIEAEEIRRAGELDSLRARQAKLKDQVETCEREIAAVQTREQQLLSNNRHLNHLLRGEKDEITKLLNALASQAAQHLHEMEKKEQEVTRLKEKMTDKRDKRGTIEILNVLTRPDGKRSTWKTGKSLGKIWAWGPEKGAEHIFPYEAFQEQWCRFRNAAGVSGSHLPRADEHQPDPVISITDHEKEIVKLKEENEQSRALISQLQLCFREELASSINMELPTYLKDSYFLEEEQRLKEERAVFEEQRQTFQTERKNFTEAAIRLGWERKQFEEEKALLLKQEFLRSLPRLEVRDPKRRLSAPVAAREHDHLPRQRRGSRPMSTPYSKLIITPSHTPIGLFRSQPWHLTSNPSPLTRAELDRQTALLPGNGPVPSLQLCQRKENHQDASCQTELVTEDDFQGDFLDCSMESSFLGLHAIGIQGYL
ncbi:afadin- and alpha-actinin-binding protein-like [Sphaerodactylus townsendi]|uniref:afadin- and alpha-actinin-binding protein-like n=1 Tax=Sphaerodactylus townsendi TaxID=933632 RepID=UPI0020261B61|nr:afadin- and alpha-actinin-binding protein-like [Sphaerodactylus townsendi]